MTLRIAIVGGGIGGLALAALLQRRGGSCTVYEALPAADFAEVQGEVQLSQVGLSVLREALDAPLPEAELAPVLPLTVLSHSASPLLLLDDSQGPLAGLKRASYAQLRARLVARIAPERLHFGARVVSVSQGGGAVLLDLEDGTEASADLTVIAAGEDPALRRQVWGDAPRSLELLAIRGTTAPGGSLPSGCVGAVRILGNGCSFHAAQAEPLGPMTWTFSRKGRIDELAGRSSQALRDEVAFLTSEWKPDVRPLLEQTADAALSIAELNSLDLPERLSMGGLTLLGDAAHAATPFLELGAELALQEAMALAVLLDRATPQSLGASQERYDQEVRARARGDLNRALFNAKLFHLAGPLARFLRDSSLRLLEAGLEGSAREQLPPGR